MISLPFHPLYKAANNLSFSSAQSLGFYNRHLILSLNTFNSLVSALRTPGQGSTTDSATAKFSGIIHSSSMSKLKTSWMTCLQVLLLVDSGASKWLTHISNPLFGIVSTTNTVIIQWPRRAVPDRISSFIMKNYTSRSIKNY